MMERRHQREYEWTELLAVLVEGLLRLHGSGVELAESVFSSDDTGTFTPYGITPLDADEDWDLEEAEKVAPAALAALPVGLASACGVVAFSWTEVDALAAFLVWCDGRKDLLVGARKRGQPPLAARAKALRMWGPQWRCY